MKAVCRVLAIERGNSGPREVPGDVQIVVSVGREVAKGRVAPAEDEVRKNRETAKQRGSTKRESVAPGQQGLGDGDLHLFGYAVTSRRVKSRNAATSDA